MEFEEKIEYLNSIGTGSLIKRIGEAEDHLQVAMEADRDYRAQWVPYLASYNEDCTAVKNFMAELEPPTTDKMTVAAKENWLRTQRTANQNLVSMILCQNQVTFKCESNRIEIEMAKKRLESLKAILNLRTTQIAFLVPEG